MLGLDFLHEQAIIHSGIFCNAIVAKVAIDIFLDLQPVEWLSGAEVEDSAPRYLIPSQRLRGMLDDVDFQRLSIQIGDLDGGSAPFLASELLMFANPYTSHLERSPTRCASSNSQILVPSWTY